MTSVNWLMSQDKKSNSYLFIKITYKYRPTFQYLSLLKTDCAVDDDAVVPELSAIIQKVTLTRLHLQTTDKSGNLETQSVFRVVRLDQIARVVRLGRVIS